jgi:chromosomal replication initiation ATPase DnaA
MSVFLAAVGLSILCSRERKRSMIRGHGGGGGFTIDRLIVRVGERCGTDPSLIKSAAKQRDASRAKGIVCYLAGRVLGMTGTAIAGALDLTPSAVCKLARKGRDDLLSKEIENLVLADR